MKQLLFHMKQVIINMKRNYLHNHKHFPSYAYSEIYRYTTT